MSTATAHRTRLILCLGTVYVVWSASFLVTKIGVGSLPPFLFGSLRFVIGGLLLLIVARMVASELTDALAIERPAHSLHRQNSVAVGTCLLFQSERVDDLVQRGGDLLFNELFVGFEKLDHLLLSH